MIIGVGLMLKSRLSLAVFPFREQKSWEGRAGMGTGNPEGYQGQWVKTSEDSRGRLEEVGQGGCGPCHSAGEEHFRGC